mmetsp:Transcript_31197/g.47774  ORF Transcript_31197/g.47774 Transcript_31197/m.47774 type:complete len:191 (+) Transcript_31197:996-1568(+)
MRNHAYFKHFFKSTTDIFFLRIVDQMAQMNEVSLRQAGSAWGSLLGETSFQATDPLASRQLLIDHDKCPVEEPFSEESSSHILSQEVEGDNFIVSDDAADIVKTIKILNDTYIHSNRNFVNLVNREFSAASVEDPSSAFYIPVLSYFVKVYKVVTNFLTAQLMNDNFYAFSYDSSLLNSTIEQLETHLKK